MENYKIIKKAKIVIREKWIVRKNRVIKNKKSLGKHIQKISSVKMERATRIDQDKKVERIPWYQKNNSNNW